MIFFMSLSFSIFAFNMSFKALSIGPFINPKIPCFFTSRMSCIRVLAFFFTNQRNVTGFVADYSNRYSFSSMRAIWLCIFIFWIKHWCLLLSLHTTFSIKPFTFRLFVFICEYIWLQGFLLWLDFKSALILASRTCL